MTYTSCLVATEDHAWQRLDRVLEVLLPDMGLRGRRRLCALGLVLVNGKPALEAKKIKPGDVLEIMGTSENADHGDATAPGAPDIGVAKLADNRTALPQGVQLVERDQRWAAIAKPAGLHTESLAGKPGASLQKMLPSLLEAEDDAEIMLLNRLDFPTSGLVMAALNWQSAAVWETAQRNGHTEKRYIALLEGAMSCPHVARNTLNAKGRQRVLATQDDYPDRRRHTSFEPLAVLDAESVGEFVSAFCPKSGSKSVGRASVQQVTLAGCIILKGARHQIRAHASAMGFPLLGDVRYGAAWALSEESVGCGDDISPEKELFFLHHGRIVMPDFSAALAPSWLPLLGKDAECAAREWLLK